MSGMCIQTNIYLIDPSACTYFMQHGMEAAQWKISTCVDTKHMSMRFCTAVVGHVQQPCSMHIVFRLGIRWQGWTLTLLRREPLEMRCCASSMLMRLWLKEESRLEEGYMRDSMLASSRLGLVFVVADSMLAR